MVDTEDNLQTDPAAPYEPVRQSGSLSQIAEEILHPEPDLDFLGSDARRLQRRHEAPVGTLRDPQFLQALEQLVPEAQRFHLAGMGNDAYVLGTDNGVVLRVGRGGSEAVGSSEFMLQPLSRHTINGVNVEISPYAPSLSRLIEEGHMSSADAVRRMDAFQLSILDAGQFSADFKIDNVGMRPDGRLTLIDPGAQVFPIPESMRQYYANMADQLRADIAVPQAVQQQLSGGELVPAQVRTIAEQQLEAQRAMLEHNRANGMTLLEVEGRSVLTGPRLGERRHERLPHEIPNPGGSHTVQAAQQQQLRDTSLAALPDDGLIDPPARFETRMQWREGITPEERMMDFVEVDTNGRPVVVRREATPLEAFVRSPSLVESPTVDRWAMDIPHAPAVDGLASAERLGARTIARGVTKAIPTMFDDLIVEGVILLGSGVIAGGAQGYRAVQNGETVPEIIAGVSNATGEAVGENWHDMWGGNDFDRGDDVRGWARVTDSATLGIVPASLFIDARRSHIELEEARERYAAVPQDQVNRVINNLGEHLASPRALPSTQNGTYNQFLHELRLIEGYSENTLSVREMFEFRGRYHDRGISFDDMREHAVRKYLANGGTPDAVWSLMQNGMPAMSEALIAELQQNEDLMQRADGLRVNEDRTAVVRGPADGQLTRQELGALWHVMGVTSHDLNPDNDFVNNAPEVLAAVRAAAERGGNDRS